MTVPSPGQPRTVEVVVSLKDVVEDVLLLAFDVLQGDPSLELEGGGDTDEINGHRVAELIVGIAEDVARIAGIEECVVPEDLRDMTDLVHRGIE